MADYDPSSIPILDDIITKGDTEKAASRPESDLLESLEPEQDEASDKTTEHSETTPEPEIAIEPSIEDRHAEEASLSAPESGDISDKSTFDTSTDYPSDETTEEPPINIETLTEDILASVMPEMERLLRDRIRQALEHQLQNDVS